MRRFIALASLALLACLAFPVAAQTGVGLICFDCPCPVRTTGSGILLITPEGRGDALEDIGLDIRISIVDCNDDPLEGFPFDDLWLQPSSLNVVFATPFFAAANTDASGETYWTGPAAGGGWMDANGPDRTRIALMGSQIFPEIELSFVSPDINGDLRVDLADVAIMALDWSSAWTFRSDLTADGRLDLADIGVLAAHFGEDGN